MFNIWKQRGWRASQFKPEDVVTIVSNAAIANEMVGDGRLLPLVILDTTKRPDLVDLFRVHEKTPPGDADSCWVSIAGFDQHLALALEFKKPFEIKFVINFDLTDDGMAVDLAMRGRAIYLQAGKPGDRFYRTVGAPGIIVELGADLPKRDWERIWQKAIGSRLRAEGVSRADAKRLAPEYMQKIREMFSGFSSKTPGMYVLDPD